MFFFRLWVSEFLLYVSFLLFFYYLLCSFCRLFGYSKYRCMWMVSGKFKNGGNSVYWISLPDRKWKTHNPLKTGLVQGVVHKRQANRLMSAL